MFESVDTLIDAWTPARFVYYKLTLRSFGSAELKNKRQRLAYSYVDYMVKLKKDHMTFLSYCPLKILKL